MGTRAPVFLQQTDTECGLACLAMTVAYHDPRATLDALRSRYAASQRGNTLAQLADLASDMGFVARGLMCRPEQLVSVQLPAIAHWDLNHFVVVTRITRRYVEIIDPAIGVRRLTHRELGERFTGYVLELQPTVKLDVPIGSPSLTTFRLLRKIGGLGSRLRSLIAVGLLIELLGLSSPILVQLGVDTAVQSTDRFRLVVLTSAFLVLIAIQALTTAGREYATSRLSARVSQLMSLSAFRSVMRWTYAEITARSSGEILSRFGSLDNLRSALVYTTVQLCLDLVMVSLALAVISLYAPILGVLGVVVLAGYAVLRRSFIVQQMSLDAASVQHLSRQQTILVETLRAAHVIKAYGAEHSRQAAYDAAVSPAVYYQSRSQRMGGLIRAGWLAGGGAQSIIVVALALHLVQMQALTIGMLYAVIAINTLLLQRGGSAVELFSQLSVLRVHVDRASLILREGSDEPDSAFSSLPSTRPAANAVLSVKNVAYRYSPRDAFVLNDVSFEAQPGQVVALTGPSGCGKSTLLKVVAGMLDPERGSVTIGGQRLAPTSLGLVLQDDLLLSGSILDNITFFASEPDVVWAEECARMASILSDIEAMPMQMHTRVGESGSSLSGGQRQRIMLARALYRRPALLVLDEATSHLDSVNERHIVATLRRLGITIVQAAHRAETLAGADVVIELGMQGGIHAVRPMEAIQ